MRRLVADPVEPDPLLIAEAAVALNAGLLFAFPTETVYGLGAHALDPAAVRRVYEAKGRPAFNPVIVHVADALQAQSLVTEWPVAAERLASAFWPGPLTLVLPRVAAVPNEVTAGLDTVGLRVPAHPVALALLRAAAVPVAAPSANRFAELSPTTADHVAQSLGARVDILLDGGPTSVGIESTVVDLSSRRPRILRMGMITPAMIAAATDMEVDASPPATSGDAPRQSPGQVDRHYAPRARLTVVEPYVLRGGGWGGAGTRTSGVLTHSDVGALGFAYQLRLPEDPDGYARRLYAALHQLDDAGCTEILVEQVPPGPAWDAIRDRLERASR